MNEMKKVILTVVVAVLATSGMAQSDCGLLLDHNQDGIIGVEDLMNLLSLFGQPIGIEEGPCGNQQSVFFDDHEYSLVPIGDQCWFAENLRTRIYQNGDSILNSLTESEWNLTTQGATSIYGEGEGDCFDYSPIIDACEESESLNLYGRLYNWYAVSDSRGLCPAGWRIPSLDDYEELEITVSELGYDDIESSAIKSTSGWYLGCYGNPNTGWEGNQGSDCNGTNVTGFNALPGGFRWHGDNNGQGFTWSGTDGWWWSSTDSLHVESTGPVQLAVSLYLGSGDGPFSLNVWQYKFGFSVRCIKDPD